MIYLFCFNGTGNLAEYLNIFAIIILAIFVYEAGNKRHNESKQLQHDLNKPIIIFKLLQLEI